MHNEIVRIRGLTCILRCNIDCFLLNQKDLESMSILPKKICNMHIAHILQ